MNRTALVSIVFGILIAVSVVHKLRKGAEVFGHPETGTSSSGASSASTSLSSSALAPAPAPVPTHTPPAASAPTGTGTATATPAPAPANSTQSSFAKITAKTDAMLEKVRNDPSLSPTERKLKESEIAQMKMQMMQSAVQIDAYRASQPTSKSATTITAPISTPAAPITVPNPDPAPIPAPPPGTKVPSS